MKINILIDNHLPINLENYPLSDLDTSALRDFLADVRPYRLTAFAYGHDGWAQYPSTLSASPPGMRLDLVDLWRGLALEAGCRFGIYVSTLINHRLLQTKREWERTGLENNPTGRIDHTSPYLEQWLKPTLSEIIERYQPEGFFFDGDYWTVGESLSSIRAPSAQALFPQFQGNDLSSLTTDEHRRLTLETYRSYLKALADFLEPRAPKSCVNLAFSFRHPVDRLPGLDLTTSDLPPFFAVIDCWLETAVLPGKTGEREVLVPLFVEPEGGGRKYTKTLPQVVQEVAPIIAMNEAIHVYFPMSVEGRLNTSYLSLLKAVKEEVSRVSPNAFDESYSFQPDVVCLADTDLLEMTQDFSQLRGAAILTFTAGMNVCIANTARCMESLHTTRLLLAPKILSSSAQNCLDEASKLGIPILQEDFGSANHTITRLALESIVAAYIAGPPSWFSQFAVRCPPCAFVRAFRGARNRWRLFIFNSCERAAGLGRHVISDGAGFAGRISINMPLQSRFERIEGYVGNLSVNGRQIAFDLNNAFAIVDGVFEP